MAHFVQATTTLPHHRHCPEHKQLFLLMFLSFDLFLCFQLAVLLFEDVKYFF